MNENYYTINEVSEMLKVAYMTVYRWIRAKKLRAFQVQKQFRIKESDLKDFINQKPSN